MFLLIMCFAVGRKLINIIWMHELNHLLLQSVPTLWTIMSPKGTAQKSPLTWMYPCADVDIRCRNDLEINMI